MFETFVVPSHLKPSDPRFGCGPSVIPASHLEALAKTGITLMGTSHRQSAVKNLVGEIISGLKTYFKVPDEYTVVLGNGGATLLFDMIGLGVVEKSSAHFTCGEFSNKWYLAHKAIPWIEAKEFSVPAGQGIDAKAESGFDMICTTLNETSTGVQFSSIPQVDANTILAVDATSGGGQVPCDVSKTDIFFFSPQKVFASDGGLWVAIMSPKAINRALKIEKDSSRYVPHVMNWKQAIENSTKNQTYNTPAVATLFLLNEQLKVLNAVGYQGVIEGAQKKANLLYGWAESKPYLSPFIKESKYRSTAVATIDVDDKYKVDDLLGVLRKQKVIMDIDAYRKLGRNQFRISMFHNITYENLEKLTQILSMAIELA
jgi:phosphoserine aminotransferase